MADTNQIAFLLSRQYVAYVFSNYLVHLVHLWVSKIVYLRHLRVDELSGLDQLCLSTITAFTQLSRGCTYPTQLTCVLSCVRFFFRMRSSYWHRSMHVGHTCVVESFAALLDFRSNFQKRCVQESVEPVFVFWFRSFEHLNYIFDPKKLLQWQQHQCI